MRLHPSVLLIIVLACGVVAAAEKAPATRDEALAQLDFRQVIRAAKDKVFPAVVYIKVIQESHESGRKVSSEVAGSGVIISPDGDILTNWHVVDKAVEVRCLLYDGRAMTAKVVGSDKDTDLALVRLKVPADAGTVPHAVLGDSGVLMEGDFVMAMGAPWGLSRSVSIGIVSCTRRFLPLNSEYSLWIQTDAAISPGNSGGPLVNTDGEVVGINTLGVLFGGDMGFAVPSDPIRHIVGQIREVGRVNCRGRACNSSRSATSVATCTSRAPKASSWPRPTPTAPPTRPASGHATASSRSAARPWPPSPRRTCPPSGASWACCPRTNRPASTSCAAARR